MSASTLNPSKPRGRLGQLVTLNRLATAVTWYFWLFTVAFALQAIVALTRVGELGAPHLNGQPLRVWMTIAPPLLRHAASGLTHSGLVPGVQATWSGAILGIAQSAHPTAGQALAFTLTLLPPGLLRVGTLYLTMRLARTAARDGIYTAQAARLVLILGWWLLGGALVASLTEGFAQLNLLSQLVTWPVNWAQWPASWGISWPVEWFGLGLIIFARIMRVSAGMRADLEGTV